MTPWGKKGFFHDSWEHGGDKWVRFRVPATECPRLPAERLKLERAEMGDREFRREYMCEFQATEAQMFDSDLVRAAMVQEEAWEL